MLVEETLAHEVCTRTSGTEDPYEVEVDALSPDTCEPAREKAFVVLPHEVFAVVASAGGATLRRHFGDPALCRAFWENAALELPDHPTVRGDESMKDRTYPLGIHGDSAVFTKATAESP